MTAARCPPSSTRLPIHEGATHSHVASGSRVQFHEAGDRCRRMDTERPDHRKRAAAVSKERRRRAPSAELLWTLLFDATTRRGARLANRSQGSNTTVGVSREYWSARSALASEVVGRKARVGPVEAAGRTHQLSAPRAWSEHSSPESDLIHGILLAAMARAETMCRAHSWGVRWSGNGNRSIFDQKNQKRSGVLEIWRSGSPRHPGRRVSCHSWASARWLTATRSIVGPSH